jgi:hypothetical protein
MEYFLTYTRYLFQKPISVFKKGFGKLLINWWFYEQFVSGFPKPLYSLEISLQNKLITTAMAFQNLLSQTECPKSMESSQKMFV